MKKYIGIDNGSSGAIASLNQQGAWKVQRVVRLRVGTHWLLDVEQNIAILQQMAEDVGGVGNLIVAYEASRKNDMFGARNNYVNGRNEEFWRVAFSLLKVHQHTAVDPKTWQSVCLKGIPAGEPKARARQYIGQCCPEAVWLEEMNKAPREAFVDAMCVALWCRNLHLQS
jgi:hypothetical protein